MSRLSTLVSVLITSYTRQRLGDALEVLESLQCQSHPNDVIAFVDDEALPRKEWLERLFRNFEDPEVLVGGGQVVPLWEGERPSSLPEELDWVLGCTYRPFPTGRGQVRNVIGCNMAFRRDVFQRASFFSPPWGCSKGRFRARVETELYICLPARLPKAKIIYDPRRRGGIPIDRAHISDVAPTVLSVMGLPIPDGMEVHLIGLSAVGSAASESGDWFPVRMAT